MGNIVTAMVVRQIRGRYCECCKWKEALWGFQAPPWQEPDRYRRASPILQAGNVRTPLMLVHGDLDFVAVQQAEEFFTALYRQDLRASFLRYYGEGHGISNRHNVIDLWARMRKWLVETMSDRN
jgi:dipeptidyl aminopeptidase/acylaminoacyl peptidase